jgi:hypothetical protein
MFPEIPKTISRLLRLGMGIMEGPIPFTHTIPKEQLSAGEVVGYYSFANDTNGNFNMTNMTEPIRYFVVEAPTTTTTVETTTTIETISTTTTLETTTTTVQTTTTTTTVPFDVHSFTNATIEGGYKCNVSYTNSIGENAVFVFLYADNQTGKVVSAPTIILPQGSGEAGSLFYCTDFTSGVYAVKWRVYNESDQKLLDVKKYALTSGYKYIVC